MEDFESTYIGKLWNILLNDDKRSFNEYFSEEFGITLDDCITDKQICFLCKSMMRLNDEQLREVDSIREYQWEDGSWIDTNLEIYETDFVIVDSKTKKPMEGYENIYHYTSVIENLNEKLMKQGCEYISMEELSKEDKNKYRETIKEMEKI
tara:strand:- start:2573 stop:3025 length:453 start_codon:yes stop_codon:yes gene_type:complete